MLTSPRLRAGVALYAADGGHLLRVDGADHHVHLDDADATALLDALLDGGPPATAPARGALAALVDAGLADAAPTRVSVVGDGRLAGALRAAAGRMGAAGDDLVVRADDAPTDDATCWMSGHRVVLRPPAVPAGDVEARHRAATRHRGVVVRTGGRGVVGTGDERAGLELAAVTVVADLRRPDRHPLEAVVVDLDTLVVSRHRVLPVPPAPR
ncbi:hypothetical protein ABFT23_03570 [Nocardioides sp. C4-1]|uniref:hypothetical protein n=1 Tax=Nocardioides sp. C4-1 TaxID=3151851 RepID=UPI0032678299